MEGSGKASQFAKGDPGFHTLCLPMILFFFGEASKEQARVIKDNLVKFCQASGQKLSTQKSRIYFSPFTNEATIAEVCNTLEISRTNDFGKYLGVPTLHGRVTKATFQEVLNRVDRRLAGWKAKCLSLAGRTTLIQATINAIPAYTMQTSRIPRSVCDELDKKIRRFLWGGSHMERKPHLVSWDVVTKEWTEGGLGLRKMRHLNSAYLMKLGWRVESEPNSLWARVIRAKYCKAQSGDILMARHRSTSNAWRGILETLEWTKRGAGMAVGDGRQTKFWYHRWLDGLVLHEHAVRAIPEDHVQNRVCDYWRMDTGWDWHFLSQHLPSNIQQRIASVELINEEVGNKKMWIASKSGRFSIRSALSLIRPDNPSPTLDWRWVWRVRAPYHIQMFLWLLLHNKLLTNAERFKRHMGISPKCVICDAEEEDLNHVLRFCTNATRTWQSTQSPTVIGTESFEGITAWLQHNLAHQLEDPNWPTKFLITLWYIWKWRCMICFGSQDDIPMERHHFLTAQFWDILNALSRDRDHNQSKLEQTYVKWQPPPEGWVILNTDGAAKGNPGRAGAGGVLRGDRGEWILGFSEFLGHCSSMKAELRAISRGLQLAAGAGFRKIWVQTDSRVVVGMLTNKMHWHPEHHFLLQRCSNWLRQEDWEVKITHCFREANHVADILANKGVEGTPGVTKYPLPPGDIRDALYADDIGVSWPRLVKIQ